MGSRNWTQSQMDAINARGGSLLVSAAAGSGKTAVLVQRVISGNNSIANPSVFVRPNDKGTNAADKSTMDSLLYLTWADDSVSWYSYNTGGAYAQLNTYGTTYLYIILGYDKATEDAE